MKRTLRELLRIRKLVEELAQVDFESRSTEMRSLRTAAERQREIERSIRVGIVQHWTVNQAAMVEARVLDRAEREIAGRKEARLEALAEEMKPGVNRAREEFLTRRLERRQVEVLHAAEQHAEEKRRIRQDQNRTDDWFQTRPAKRKPARE